MITRWGQGRAYANDVCRRWIFIIEGLLTIVVAVAAFWFIADWPSKAKFITEDEREYINARLKANSDATQNEGFSWSNVLLALKDPKVNLSSTKERFMVLTMT